MSRRYVGWLDCADEGASPIKGNVLPLPSAGLTGPAAESRNADDFVFKVPELPRDVSPKRAPASASARPEVSLARADGSTLPPAATVTRGTVDGFEFKVPDLPRVGSPAKVPTTGSARVEASPSRGINQLPPARLASPARSSRTTTTARTMFTPRTRQAETERTPHKRNPSSDYRTTTLPPRTPLAERGYGPQSAKKASTSSLSGVLAETDGRSLNARMAGGAVAGSGMKRSATVNDFAPGQPQDRGEKTSVAGRHMRTPSDTLVRSGSSTLLDANRRKTAPSPTRIAKPTPLTGATSRIRLPGQGLRQVSGQGKVGDADARSRKQATSPEKLLAAGKARVSLVPKPKSPPRQRTGFRPVTSQQSAPARAVDRSSSTAPSRPVAAGRLPVARPGSSSSTMTTRTSTIPSRTSATTTRPSGSAAGSTTRMPAPSATMAAKASNGLPRPTSRIAPSGTARTGSTTSVSSTSRLTAQITSQDRHGLSTARTGSALPRRNPLIVAKPDNAVRSRLDRFQPTHE